MATNQQTRTALRADRLRMLRERRGWSQRELARHCGLGESQVNKYEASQTDPSAKYLKALAETLDVSTDYLLGMTDNPHGQLGETYPSEYSQLIEAADAGDMPTVLNIIADMLRRQAR